MMHLLLLIHIAWSGEGYINTFRVKATRHQSIEIRSNASAIPEIVTLIRIVR